MEQVDLKICIVCNEPKAEGITIVTEFICTSCETEMVHTKVEDEKYPFFVHKMKQVCLRFDA